jgi:hypothetical protein
MSIAKSKGGLGFRDFQKFNDAMLGKQAWRLLVNQTSLCDRVLKGRYFPNGDILSAGCLKSKVRRAIICGREVLKKGLVRRTGDGQYTLIWDNQWLIGVPVLKPLYRDEITRNNGTELTKVSELLDQGTWMRLLSMQPFVH